MICASGIIPRSGNSCGTPTGSQRNRRPQRIQTIARVGKTTYYYSLRFLQNIKSGDPWYLSEGVSVYKSSSLSLLVTYLQSIDSLPIFYLTYFPFNWQIINKASR